ncbi:MAG: arsenate reductase ArsC [bacterium]|nr:arsenate reductase ArsC [bacterium]
MKQVLILCTANSCRSQMAEGFLNALGENRFQVFSAGTHPSAVNPLAIQAMAETNIDISGHSSDGIDAYAKHSFDDVISVCDRGKCPVFPAKTQMIHWSFDDPAEAQGTEAEQMLVFRRVRDKIRSKIESYIKNHTE